MVVERLLARAASVFGERPAIVHGTGRLSYAELGTAVRSRASAISRELSSQHSVVAVRASRDASSIINVLAVCVSGNIPLVLDSLYPSKYVDELVSYAGAAAILEGTLPDGPLRTINSGSARPVLDAGDAYVSFTSGTSGKPKCVVAQWAAIDHYLSWSPQVFGDGRLLNFVLASGVSHDPFWRDLLAPLSVGGTLFIPSVRQWANAGLFAEFLVDCQIEALCITPTLLKNLLADRHLLPGICLRRVLIGGEILTGSVATRAAGLLPGARLFNVYGLTETPQIAAYQELSLTSVKDGESIVPIGAPAPGFEFSLADGVLQLESAFVARKRIAPGGRVQQLGCLLDTRDLAEVHADRYTVRGRSDRVVTIRGARVDLAHVEAALVGLDYVDTARVAAHDGQLVARIASKPGAEVTARTISRDLAQRVPLPEIPAHIELLPAHETVTLNGKAQ
jgi:non-ribosomal peptide synthetase component F